MRRVDADFIEKRVHSELTFFVEVVGAILGPNTERRKSGMLVAKRNIGSVPQFETETLSATALSELTVFRAPAPITVREAVHFGKRPRAAVAATAMPSVAR